MTVVLALSLLVNAAVVLALAWGWRVGRHDLAERLYLAPNRERRRTFFDAFPVVPGDVVFVGDSLVANAHWSEIFPGRPVKNRGIGGDTTATLLDRVEQAGAGHPAKIFLMIGTNDLGIGIPHDRIVATYAAILDRLRGASPGTEVIVLSVLPRSPALTGRVRALNAALAGLATERNLRFLDLTAIFAGANGAMSRAFSNDDLHLLGAGYVAWRAALLPFVDGAGA